MDGRESETFHWLHFMGFSFVQVSFWVLGFLGMGFGFSGFGDSSLWFLVDSHDTTLQCQRLCSAIISVRPSLELC